MIDSVIILGSTGSIGTQTLEVCRHLGIRVTAMAAGRNIDLLEAQAREWRPNLISVAEAVDALELQHRLADLQPKIEIMHGMDGCLAVATSPGASMVVAAMVGVAGLAPVLAAIRAGKNIALANKETLVAGGSLVMPLIRQTGLALYPVDSEHSAIWQCLAGTTARQFASNPADCIRRTISRPQSGGTCQHHQAGSTAPSNLADGRQDHD